MLTKVFMVAVLLNVGLLLCITEYAWGDFLMDQWEVLRSIYSSTNGEHWLRKDSWNFSEHSEISYCFWYGIDCINYRITGIFLIDNNLNGSLPPTLWKLRYLEKIFLNSNKNLGGTLEDFIYGNMTQLKTIDLSFCGFEGAIPEEITFLTNLEELRLCSQRGERKLNGSIPEGIANLTNLRVLGLGGNSLSAPSPRFIGTLTKLEVLDLESVNLNSTFEVFSHRLTGLKFLNLSKTRLFGELPPNLEKRFPKMEELLLPGNYLNGSIPHNIGRMKNLKRLSLANNKLSGVIPGNTTLGSSLSFIDLSVNNFSSIEHDSNSTLFLSHDLEILLLSDNPHLTVSFEAFLQLDHTIRNAGPAKLNVLIINHCKFYGKIPKSLWSFSNLVYVNIGHNELQGRLPEVLAPMYSLLHFDVSHNYLEGTIPSTLTRIESLHHLNIRGNSKMIACHEHDDYEYCQAKLEQHGLEITYDTMTTGKGNFSCPSAMLRVNKGAVFLDAKYYGYAFCKCEPGYYGEGKTCRKCMEGGRCVDTNNHYMTIRKGFWPEPDPKNVTHLTICNDKEGFFSADGRRLTTCNPLGNCSCHLNRTSAITTCNRTCLCRKGSTDRLCSRCEKRWYKGGSICRKCPSQNHATYIFIGVLFVTLLVFFAALRYLKNRPRLSLLVIFGQIIMLLFLRIFNVIPSWVFEINAIILLFYLAGMGSSMKGLMKIAVFYLQILDAMLSTYNLWPRAILRGQQYISSLINFNFPGLMCDIPDLYTPAGQFILLILLPITCISITWSFYCLVSTANRIRGHSWNVLSIKYHCLQISVTCLNLTYFPIGLRSIAVLASCRGHSSHMHIAPWIACNSQDSSFLQALAWLSTVIYVIGVPLFIFLPLLLCYVRADKRSELTKHEKEAFDKWLGSIYLPYKEKYRSFCEVYVLLRKLLLAFLIGYIPEVCSLQTFFVSLVLAVALIFHLVWQPYQSSLGWIPIENILETIVLVVLQQSFILLRFTTVEKPSEKRVALLWIIVAVNCTVVFFLVVIISVLLVKHAAKSLKNRSRNESSRIPKLRKDFLSYFKSKNSLFKPLLPREDKDTNADE